VRVGFITVDQTVHFYDITPGRRVPQMLVMPDVAAGFPALAIDAIAAPYQRSKQVQ
jgi:hypothetical protein